MDTLGDVPEVQRLLGEVSSNLPSTKINLRNALAVLKQKITPARAVTCEGIISSAGFKIFTSLAVAAAEHAIAGITLTGTQTKNTRTGTSSSSSSSASPSDSPIYYTLGTKPGTSLLQFQTMIKTFPDEGQGQQIHYPNVDIQGYWSVALS